MRKMSSMLLVVVLACVTSPVWTQTLTCPPDICKTTVCEPVQPCQGLVFQNTGVCGCCPQCVITTGSRGVGYGGRCGPPSYLSCDSNLECRNGSCEYPAVGKPCGPPSNRQCEEYLECRQGTCQHKIPV